MKFVLGHRSRACGACALASLSLASGATRVFAQDSAGLGDRPRRVLLENFLRRYEGDRRQVRPPIELGGWTYEARRTTGGEGEEPWELTVRPAGAHAASWRTGAQQAPLPALVAERHVSARTPRNPDAVPVVEMPEPLWQRWMSADFRDVVGVHFHVLVTDDVARILYAIRPAPGEKPATRIDATLLTPVVYSLEQTIVVRQDPLRKELAAARGQHELGHADVSQKVLIEALAGPQDWDPARSLGRRSRLEYYWKREQVGRSWAGYRDGLGKVASLRTSIALVPPTRWSLLLPIPPERVTQEHLEAFNESIVHIGGRFEALDRAAQEQFHARHGAHEQAPGP